MSKYIPILAILIAVIALGIFAYTSEALTYAGSRPETCANCHVMDAAYENWYHGPHEKWTECVDCHLPHQNVLIYYLEKGRTGMHDVYIFSTGQTPELIRAKPETKTIIMENCIRCHKNTIEAVVMGPQTNDRFCWDCHRNVAHGARGLTLLPMQDSTLYPTK
jgi:cytochrome c nitrite reductase small subunit